MASVQPDLKAFTEARWERYCQLAATVCLCYEYLITWSEEWQYFWKKRWTFGKCLFLWSRYYSVCFNIGNCIVFMQEHPTLDFRFFHWQNTGAALQVITTHTILGLRLYAMYESSKKILALLLLLLIGEITTMGVIFGIPKPGEVGTNNPFPGLLLCADGDPSDMHWVAFYWTATLAGESILLSLSLYKAWENSRTGAGGTLMKILSRDSVLYFFFIFWIYAGNQAIWLINDLTLNELGTGFSFCISAILANRLMIAVRSKYYSETDVGIKDGFGESTNASSGYAFGIGFGRGGGGSGGWRSPHSNSNGNSNGNGGGRNGGGGGGWGFLSTISPSLDFRRSEYTTRGGVVGTVTGTGIGTVTETAIGTVTVGDGALDDIGGGGGGGERSTDYEGGPTTTRTSTIRENDIEMSSFREGRGF